MQLQTGTQLQQKQTLIMTPRLQQAIEILQMPALELRNLLEQEMQANPLLEMNHEDTREISLEDTTQKLDQGNWEESHASQMPVREKSQPEKYLAHTPSLGEFLLEQINLILTDRREKQIARFLIGCLDERGFLSLSVARVAAHLSVPEALVEKVRSILREQEPVGCGSLTIQEVFSSQLQTLSEEERGKEEAQCLLEQYWQPLQEKGPVGLAQSFPGGREALIKGLQLLQRLLPYPAQVYNCEGVQYLEPDIMLFKVEQSFEIHMNDQLIPRLRLNKEYHRMLRNQEHCSETQRFLEKKLKAAHWLLRCLEQRRQTLHHIMEALLAMQRDFFYGNRRLLRPLTLREVAEQVGVHLTTVWRATNGKYVQTPKGLFALKYFFNSGVASREGGVASISVKEMIKDLLAEEEPVQPLSDEDLARFLKTDWGVDISRRTVAKYRQQMSIPASTQRRKLLN